MTLMMQPVELNFQPTAAGDDEATAEEQLYRANAYELLAALLRDEPTEALLRRVGQFTDAGEGADELALSMALLGLTARTSRLNSTASEYFALFIGLGRGELVPYGSWYQTGFLMERPLGELREDLRALGIARAARVTEPEDHVAALCEVMALLIRDALPIERQRHFFATHMEPWMGRFFAELEAAEKAVFYRAVGRFGAAFIGFEQSYLSMPA